MIDKGGLSKYPVTDEAFLYIKQNDILFSKTLNYIIENFDEKYLSACEELMSLLRKKYAEKQAFYKSLEAFIKFSHEYLFLQAKLNKEGRYLHSSFDEVNSNVYQSRKMTEYYLDGLFLSQVLWPNHYKMVSFFLNDRNRLNFYPRILDVACGSGIYTYHMARAFNYGYLKALDISQCSIDYTDAILKCSSMKSDKIALETADIFKFCDDAKYDFVVCGELLEHVSDPSALLGKLKDILTDDGKIFMTTAIYAAEIDHIYLFNNVREVRDILIKDFDILEELILPVSLKEYTAGMDRVPINYSCFLSRAKRRL